MLLREYDGVWPEDRLLREVVMWVNAAPNNTTKTTAAAIVELERWFAADESRRELASDVGFLIKAVNETSRLYPSQPAILREAVRDGELPSSGRRFVKGEWFFVDSRAANRDESVYGADANEFNPFRELGAGILSQGIAFGGGKHVCLGRPMVTANPSSYERDTATPGAIVKTFRALYSYGMRLDSEREPEVNRRNMRGNFSAVWVTLDRERGTPR
jgi:cytochrome P450